MDIWRLSPVRRFKPCASSLSRSGTRVPGRKCVPASATPLLPEATAGCKIYFTYRQSGSAMELSEIGKTIRKARQARGLTQERLAAKAGISRATLNGLETGMVGELGFRRLAAILGILGYELAPASTLRPGRSGRSRRTPGRSKPLRNASARGILRRMARRYIWWQSPEASMRDPRRVIAQIMDVGTLEDIQRLTAAIGKRRMVEVLDHARPGWFHPKSWSFWHTALEPACPGGIPPIPARRSDALPDPA